VNNKHKPHRDVRYPNSMRTRKAEGTSVDLIYVSDTSSKATKKAKLAKKQITEEHVNTPIVVLIGLELQSAKGIASATLPAT